MPHVKDVDEQWALALLKKIVDRDRKDRDALSGSVVKLVKKAIAILKKREKPDKDAKKVTMKSRSQFSIWDERY